MAALSMQTLMDEKAKLYQELADSFGEVTEETEQKLERLLELEFAIPVKVDSWAFFLKEDIPAQIDVLKKKKQDLSDAIERLTAFKEKKEKYLHDLIVANEVDELSGEQTRIVPNLSVRQTVDLDKLEDTDGGYTVSGYVLADQYEHLIEQLKKVFVIEKNEDDIGNGDHGLVCILDVLEFTRKCNVTDLPEEHPALQKNIRPTVKILKAKLGKATKN